MSSKNVDGRVDIHIRGGALGAFRIPDQRR